MGSTFIGYVPKLENWTMAIHFTIFDVCTQLYSKTCVKRPFTPYTTSR